MNVGVGLHGIIGGVRVFGNNLRNAFHVGTDDVFIVYVDGCSVLFCYVFGIVPFEKIHVIYV